MSAASPIDAEERDLAVDVLRAVALFGVLVVNLVTIFRDSIFAAFLPVSPPRAPIDEAVHRLVAFGMETKAFTLFAFLFGLGLAVQEGRARAQGRSFAVHVARRLGALSAIGLVHLVLVWNGDILTLYAALGFVAAPLLRLPTRALAGLAVAAFVVQCLSLPWPRPFESLEAMAEHVRRARVVYGHGTFEQVLAFRVEELRPMGALLAWVAPRTLGLFLLGACAWRTSIHRRASRRALVAAAVVLLGAGAAGTYAATSGARLGALRSAIEIGGATSLAFGYAAASVLATRALGRLAPLGRMALTSYLTQSIVLGLVFYGYGLGLFGRMGEAWAFGIAVAIYAAQAAFAVAWMRRFRYGPAEWLWRWVTYGIRPPMRR